jgi:hypothetical protein
MFSQCAIKARDLYAIEVRLEFCDNLPEMVQQSLDVGVDARCLTDADSRVLMYTGRGGQSTRMIFSVSGAEKNSRMKIPIPRGCGNSQEELARENKMAIRNALPTQVPIGTVAMPQYVEEAQAHGQCEQRSMI